MQSRNNQKVRDLVFQSASASVTSVSTRNGRSAGRKPSSDAGFAFLPVPVTPDPLSFEEEEFQELLEFGKQSLDLFEIYPKVLAERLTAKAKSLPVAPEAVHQTFLAIVAGIIGARSRVYVDKGWKEPMVFFTAFVAPAGSRKSPAMDVSRDPLVELQAAAHHSHSFEKEEYESEKRRYDALKPSEKRDAAPPVEPHMRHYYQEDSTIEAIIGVHGQEANKNGFSLIYDELAELFDGMDQYRGGKGSDRKKILRLFGGKDLKTDRKTKDSSTFIQRSAISITGAVQDSTLKRLISVSKDDDGLWDRFLWAFPRFVSVRDRGNPVDISPYLKGLFEEFDNLPEQDYTLSEGSKNLLYAFEQWVEDQRHEVSQQVFQAYMKLVGYVARLSLFLHIVDAIVTGQTLNQTISSDVTHRAIKLINFYIGQIHLLHSKSIQSTLENRLLAVIQLSQEKGQVSTRDIQRKRIAKTADEAAELLATLIDKGIGRVTTGARNQTLWEYQSNSGIPHLRVFTPSDVTLGKSGSNPSGESNTEDFESVTQETLNNDQQPNSTHPTATPTSPVPLPSGERRESGREVDAEVHRNGNGCPPETTAARSTAEGAIPQGQGSTPTEGAANGRGGNARQDTSRPIANPSQEVRVNQIHDGQEGGSGQESQQQAQSQENGTGRGRTVNPIVSNNKLPEKPEEVGGYRIGDRVEFTIANVDKIEQREMKRDRDMGPFIGRQGVVVDITYCELLKKWRLVVKFEAPDLPKDTFRPPLCYLQKIHE